MSLFPCFEIYSDSTLKSGMNIESSLDLTDSIKLSTDLWSFLGSEFCKEFNIAAE